MNQRTYQQIADRYGNQINVGFEFEFTVPEESQLFTSGVGDVQERADTKQVTSLDLDDFIQLFEPARRMTGIRDAEDAFEQLYDDEMSDEAEQYVKDHWEDYLDNQDDYDQEDEDEAKTQASEDFYVDKAPSKEEFFDREGPSYIIDNTNTQPIFGYTDRSEDEIFTEEPTATDDDESVVDLIIGTVEGELDDQRIDYEKVTSDGSVTWPGVEVVTPPQPLDEAIDTLWDMFDWMRRSDVQTDSSAGLHINISIENIQQLDPLKLAVFLGEEYSLKMFDRLNNQYSQSQIQTLVRRIQNNEQNKLSGTFDELTQQLKEYLLKGKYASFNLDKLAQGYLEFRIAGGKDYHRREQELTQTVYRFATAMVVASDPNAYRQQYIKKISKLVQRGEEPPAAVSELPKAIAQLNKTNKNISMWFKEYQQASGDLAIRNSLVGLFNVIAEAVEQTNTKLSFQDVQYLRKLYHKHQQQVDQLLSSYEDTAQKVYNLLRLNTQNKQMSQDTVQ